MSRAGPLAADIDAALRPPVVVLMGGPSAEHDVSIVSGQAVARALARRGWAVETWFIGLDGAWWQMPASGGAGTNARTDPEPRAYDRPTDLGAAGPLPALTALDRLAERDPRPLVWLALHGPFGEDGTVQALCQAAGLVHTGSDVAASAVGMDKALFKRLAAGLEIPVVPWEQLSLAEFAAGAEAAADRLAAFAARLPDPRLMIKPARLGSSVGMTIVHRPDEPPALERALAEAFRHDDRVLAEAYLDHPRELEVALVGNDRADLAVFGPGEVLPGREFYDYAAKYEPGLSATTVRPDLSPGLRQTVRDLAVAVFLAIGAGGLARVDFLVAGGRVYLSEINTIPGLTPISLFPQLCAAEGGLDLGALAEQVAALALARAAARPQRRRSRVDLP